MGYACKLSGLNIHNKVYTITNCSTTDLGKIHQYRYINTTLYCVYYTIPSYGSTQVVNCNIGDIIVISKYGSSNPSVSNATVLADFSFYQKIGIYRVNSTGPVYFGATTNYYTIIRIYPA